MTSLTTTHLETGSAQLLCAVRDRVAVITLNRPDAKNALSDELTPALRRMIAHCVDAPAIGAVLITGTGPAFCAGGDLKGMGGASRAVLPFDQHLAQLRVRQRTLTSALLGLRKPAWPSPWRATSVSPPSRRLSPRDTHRWRSAATMGSAAC